MAIQNSQDGAYVPQIIETFEYVPQIESTVNQEPDRRLSQGRPQQQQQVHPSDVSFFNQAQQPQPQNMPHPGLFAGQPARQARPDRQLDFSFISEFMQTPFNRFNNLFPSDPEFQARMSAGRRVANVRREQSAARFSSAVSQASQRGEEGLRALSQAQAEQGIGLGPQSAVNSLGADFLNTVNNAQLSPPVTQPQQQTQQGPRSNLGPGRASQQAVEAARLQGLAIFGDVFNPAYGAPEGVNVFPRQMSPEVAEQLPFNPQSARLKEAFSQAFGTEGFETQEEFMTALGYTFDPTADAWVRQDSFGGGGSGSGGFGRSNFPFFTNFARGGFGSGFGMPYQTVLWRIKA